MKDRAAFGTRVRELRLAGGLSMKDLSDLIHYSKPQISRVERGLARPTTTFAAACDRAFGTGDELARAAAALVLEARRAENETTSDMPAGPRRLIGRDAEVEALAQCLTVAEEPRTAHVCVLYGMAGVGKTAIALWATELMRDRYPDGRIYLDLQGYHLDHHPVREPDALDRVLRRLGVSGELVPRSVEDRRSLLRQKLADRRVLLVLDNVRSASQVAGLLPPNGRSAVIIMSRQALSALDVQVRRKVTALAPEHAVELFHWVSGLPRDSAERGDPAVVAEITRICCQLPLALCIVASRFRDNPVRRLEDLAARLTDRAARSREFDDGVRSMTAVFEASFATLSDAQRVMLALVALHPGPRVDAYAAGSLAGTTPIAAEELLDELIRAGMLERHSQSAYRLHDLLRDHLRQPATGLLSESEAIAALRRLFDYCLHTVAAADARIDEHRYRVSLDPPTSVVTVGEFENATKAKAWMDQEVDNFLPIVREMLEHGENGTCWRFVYYLRGYFYVTKQWELMFACYEQALRPAVQAQEHQAAAIMMNNLGLASAQLGKKDEAVRLYAAARAEFVSAEDSYGEMNVVANHSWLAYANGDYEFALELARTAWAFYREREQRSNAVIALDCIARCELRLGKFAEAEQSFVKAYRDFVALNFGDGDTAQLLTHLAETEFLLRDSDKAIEYYELAIQLARSGEAPREEAVAFEGLSRVARAQGRAVDAEAHFAAAIALYEEVGAADDSERLRKERIAQGSNGVAQPGSERRSDVSVEVIGGQRIRVLAINDEWASRNGGLSTLNRELCKAVAAQGAEVYCSTPSASDEERRDAESVGVHLVHPPPALGSPESALSRPPKLPSGVVPDFVIGHGRKTGEAALWLVEDQFRDAKLVHFFHVISDRAEFEKGHDAGSDAMTTAEQRLRSELAIAGKAALAVGVGPVLHHYLRDRLHGSGAPEPFRFDPGFDASEPTPGPPPHSDTMRILLVGRLSPREARLKGLDIAARALGHVLRQRGEKEAAVELVLRGVEAGRGETLATSMREWAGTSALRVVPRPYTADTATLSQDLRQSHLVLLPSRVEGFGLVGLEAITAGVPTIVSKQSGLGALLEEVRDDLLVELSTRVIPVTDNEPVDTLRWGDAVSSVLNNPRPAFSAARVLREEMAARRSWAMAAAGLIEVMKSLLGSGTD